MKKIVNIFIISILLINGLFSFSIAQTEITAPLKGTSITDTAPVSSNSNITPTQSSSTNGCKTDSDCSPGNFCKINPPMVDGICSPKTTDNVSDCKSDETRNSVTKKCTKNTTACGSDEYWSSPDNKCMPKDNTNNTECKSVNGIKICPKCLLNGQCGYNVYDTLGIRKSVRETGDPTSVGLFVQDIVLSATMFIGTVVTLAIVISGFMWIMAGASGKDPSKAKSGLINSIIGLVIVICSYMIVRLVQYIAKGF